MALCRICLECSGNMSNIYNNLQTTSHTICEIITYCTGLKFIRDDGLTSSICDFCVTNLYIANQFKETALKSNDKLQKIKNETTRIKKEEIDCDSHDEVGIYSPDGESESIIPVVNNNDVKSEVSQNTTTDKDCNIEMKSTMKINPQKDISLTPDLGLFKWDCEKCNIIFESKRELLKHENLNHKKYTKKSPKKWICEICGMVYIRRSTHWTHVRTHYPPKYCCDKCDYKSHNKQDLIKHTRIHTGTKQYQCEYCTSSYRVVSNLRAHIKRCHDKVTNHQCHICSYKCFDKIKMEMHLDMHNDIKRHACEVCGSTFRRKQNMYKHIRKCHGYEPVKKRPGRAKMTAVIQTGEITNKTINTYVCSLIILDFLNLCFLLELGI